MTPARNSRFVRMAALLRRDLTLEISYQFQFVMRLFTIFMLTASMYFISKLVRNAPELAPYGGHYFEFVVVGVIVASFVNLALGSFTRSIGDEQRAGTLEVVLSSPTGLPTFLAGSFLEPMLLTTAYMTAYVAVAIWVFGAHIPLQGVLLAVPLLGLMILSFGSLGVLSASFIILTKRGDPITAIASQAGTLFAGVFFPTSVLPGPLEFATRFVPAFYGLEGLRSVLLTHGGISDIIGDLFWLSVFAAILVPLALWSFSRAVRIARVTGTLGNY